MTSTIVRYWSSVITAAVPASALRDLRPLSLRLLVCGGVAVLLLCGAGPLACADETGERKETVVAKEVTGTIVWAGKRAISVETRRTESELEEMLIPLDQDTTVERVKALSELHRGDRVKVQYLETSEEQADGQRSIRKIVARTVALVRTASPDGTLRSSSETP